MVLGLVRPGTWHRRQALPGAGGAALPKAVTAQLLTSSQSDTILAFYLFILFVIRKAGVFTGSVWGKEKAQDTFFNKQAVWTGVCLPDGEYQPLLLTSCAALAHLPNLSDAQFLHLEYGYHLSHDMKIKRSTTWHSPYIVQSVRT